MTRGVILFASDTPTRQYTAMASYCATKIAQHLQLPVTLITDADYSDPMFDQIISVASTATQERQVGNTGVIETWKNFGRHRAYELSPYDETILLDADYICGSANLLKLFDLDQPFMCHRRRVYLGTNIMADNLETFGNNFDMWWATVVFFRRSPEAECIFEMMRMVQENYDHYAKIYRFKNAPYRNDYAISIAINTVYGHMRPIEVDIPWPLMNVEFMTDIAQKSDTTWELQFNKFVDAEQKRFKITTYNQDLHMLNKDALFEAIK